MVVFKEFKESICLREASLQTAAEFYALCDRAVTLRRLLLHADLYQNSGKEERSTSNFLWRGSKTLDVGPTASGLEAEALEGQRCGDTRGQFQHEGSDAAAGRLAVTHRNL